MNNNSNSIQQPYEVIETEETITRYFSPYSKGPTSYRNKEQISHKNNRQECPERSDPKIALRNRQFQDLYEKFNKLRTEMSELTAKFQKINLLKAQAEENISGNDFSFGSSRKTKLLENAENDMKYCHSRVSVESQTDKGDKEYPFVYCTDLKRTDPALLRKSKKLLISLIDMELQRVHSSQKTLFIEKSMGNMPVSQSNSKQLKAECIDKITEELAVLKDLEGLCG